MKKELTLKQLKQVVDDACKYAGDVDADVEIWLGNKMFRITKLSQFGVIPTFTMALGPKQMELSDE